jgi:hypothetical protein
MGVGNRNALACVITGIAAGLAMPVMAQDGSASGAGQYGPSVRPVGQGAVGLTISRVEVEIGTSSGNAARDQAALRAARAATGALRGRAYRPVLVDTALGFLVSDGTIRAASHRTTYDGALACPYQVVRFQS